MPENTKQKSEQREMIPFVDEPIANDNAYNKLYVVKIIITDPKLRLCINQLTGVPLLCFRHEILY